MTALMNIFKVPNPQIPSHIKMDSQSRFHLNFVTNGYKEVHAEARGTKNNRTEIEINTTMDSVSVETFNQWKDQISNLLGKETSALIEAEIISMANGGVFKFEQYMPIYSLLVVEYALCRDFNISKFLNQSNIGIDLDLATSPTCGQILDSIHKLTPSKIHYHGKLVAREFHPESTAYIPVTIFTFSDQKIVSFVAYNGPVTFVDPMGSIEKSHTCKQIQNKTILESVF